MLGISKGQADVYHHKSENQKKRKDIIPGKNARYNYKQNTNNRCYFTVAVHFVADTKADANKCR